MFLFLTFLVAGLFVLPVNMQDKSHKKYHDAILTTTSFDANDEKALERERCRQVVHHCLNDGSIEGCQLNSSCQLYLFKCILKCLRFIDIDESKLKGKEPIPTDFQNKNVIQNSKSSLKYLEKMNENQIFYAKLTAAVLTIIFLCVSFCTYITYCTDHMRCKKFQTITTV